MLSRVLYVVMDCSGTSVRSTRKRRGANPPAVAAAAIHVEGDAAASQKPSVAAAAEFRNVPPRSYGEVCPSALCVSGTCMLSTECVSFCALQAGRG